jgi:hypothetical protein
MTRRDLFSYGLFAAPIVLAVACQNFSPYPGIYDSVYEAGAQGNSSGGGTPDSGSEGGLPDGELDVIVTANPCASPASLVAKTGEPTFLTVDSTNVYWVTLPAAVDGGVFGSTGGLYSVPQAGGTPSSLIPNLTGAVAVANADGYLAYGTVGNAYASGMGTVGFAKTNGSGQMTPGTNILQTSGVAIDSANIYWVSDTAGLYVQSASLSGGAPISLGTASGYSSAGIAVNAGTGMLYFTGQLGAGGALFSMPTSGGTPNTIEQFTSGQPNDITTDANNVYWDDLSAGAVYSMPLAGGSITTLATGLTEPNELAVDSTNVYFVDKAIGGGIFEVPIGGAGTAKRLFASGGADIPYGVGVSSSDVYFSLYVGNAICSVPK